MQYSPILQNCYASLSHKLGLACNLAWSLLLQILYALLILLP